MAVAGWQRAVPRWLFRPDFARLEVAVLLVAAWETGAHPHWIVSQVLLVAFVMTGGRFLRRHEKEPHGHID